MRRALGNAVLCFGVACVAIAVGDGPWWMAGVGAFALAVYNGEVNPR